MIAGDVLTGPAGEATEIRRDESDGPGALAFVSGWLLRCPRQSPVWEHYLLSLVHLRPEADLPAPVVTTPGATHEVMLAALDPAGNPTVTDPASWRILRPINALEQIAVPSDEAGATMLRHLAQATVDGRLPAEPALSGQIEPWRSTVADTAAHARGEHG